MTLITGSSSHFYHTSFLLAPLNRPFRVRHFLSTLSLDVCSSVSNGKEQTVLCQSLTWLVLLHVTDI